MRTICILTSTFVLLLFSSCNEEMIGEREVSPPRIMLYLTDDPADLEAVHIEIVDVQINPQDEDSGWRSLNTVYHGTYDLLKLTGGIDTLLGEADIPEGRLQQIRLILGNGNTIQVDGQTKALKTPSAQQSGLKVQIKQDLQAGITYKLLLDFDAGKSVVKAGNSGQYLLKPVLRAGLEALSGSIRGQVDPDSVRTYVTASNQMDTIGTFTNALGQFLLRGVPEGTYQVLLSPEADSTITAKIIEGVMVQVGQSTDLGTIQLVE